MLRSLGDFIYQKGLIVTSPHTLYLDPKAITGIECFIWSNSQIILHNSHSKIVISLVKTADVYAIAERIYKASKGEY
jgi:hypothetical protein